MLGTLVDSRLDIGRHLNDGLRIGWRYEGDIYRGLTSSYLCLITSSMPPECPGYREMTIDVRPTTSPKWPKTHYKYILHVIG